MYQDCEHKWHLWDGRINSMKLGPPAHVDDEIRPIRGPEEQTGPFMPPTFLNIVWINTLKHTDKNVSPLIIIMQWHFS